MAGIAGAEGDAVGLAAGVEPAVSVSETARDSDLHPHPISDVHRIEARSTIATPILRRERVSRFLYVQLVNRCCIDICSV